MKSFPPTDAGGAVFGVQPSSCQIARQDVLQGHDATSEGDGEESLGAIVELISGSRWFDFTRLKPAMVRRRVDRRMRRLHVASLPAYVDLLQRDPREVDTLRTEILDSGAAFFRDHRVWDFIARHVVPAIMSRGHPDRPVRVWVPHCGMGAEAYSLAMLLLEHRTALGTPIPVQLFASDVGEHALETARRGRFPWIVASAVGASRLARFFIDIGQGYQVTQELRRSVVFARHDLSSDPPFSHMDLICCRYLFMHLRPSAHHIVSDLLRRSLRDDGYLVLGTAEKPRDAPGQFEAAMRRWSVYRRKRSLQETLGPGIEVAPAPLTTDPSTAVGPHVDTPPRPIPAGQQTNVVSHATVGDVRADPGRILGLITMGKLAASLAHELSQPLSAVANLLEACTIHLQSGTTSAGDVLDLLRQASALSHRAGRIVAHVTRLLRNGERRMERSELRRLVVNATELMRPILQQHGITLRLALGTTPLRSRVCRVEIEQVVVNLLQNAVDAVVRSNGSWREIGVETSRHAGSQAKVTVVDSGSGISAEMAGVMFEPFFTTKPDGFGMGLAICRSIVVAHGGRLWSEPGSPAGATALCFTVPLCPSAGSVRHERRARGRGR